MHRFRFLGLVSFGLLLSTFFSLPVSAQIGDTVVVHTLTIDSIGRAGYFHFPDTGSYEKVLMEYTMRCKHALISEQHAPNDVGCGEWDYNCETYVWDSTRTDSLQNVAPSATISNYPANTNFPFTTTGSHSITRRDEKLVSYPTTTLSGTAPHYVAGAGFNLGPFTPPSPLGNGRMYFVLHASDPVFSTIKKGSSIAGIVLPVSSGSDTLHDMRVRMHLQKGAYNFYQDTSLVEVYHATTFLSTTSDTLAFYKPFVWDGVSDVVMDLSYSGISGSPRVTLQTADSSEWWSNNGYTALSFAGSEFVPIPAAALDSISNAVSIAFWAYGDSNYLFKTNSVLCEALGAQNNREMNIHLPWSDTNVYWDCGGDSLGNFDRIQKVVSKAYAESRWNYWVFTKDATKGTMSIYLNGSLWLTDTGMHRPIHATEMLLGFAASSGLGYYGDLKEFGLYNKALDSAEVVSLMWNFAGPPAVTAYLLNDGSGDIMHNFVSGMPNTALRGVPVWHVVLGKDTPNGFVNGNSRPKIIFLQLSDTSAKDSITDRYTFDTIPDHAHIVTNFRIGHNDGFHQNDTVITVDTVYGDYLATTSYTYDETGKKVDSVNVAAQDTVKPVNLFWFTRGPQKFELMSFVTPYGLGLDLGKTGKTWEFDVTDYMTEMKGWKRLTMERGAGQEEFDLTFLFIKGTPARNVLDMDQIWPMTEESYQTIQANYRYQPLTVNLLPNAKGFKIRSYITGHGGTANGLNGEFTPQWHDITVGSTMYRRFVYKQCSLDPLYPQGGTWTIDRAGWCPGMATDLAEYEITPIVTPGTNVVIDYNVEGGVGDSRYDPGTQLVSYGPPNFKTNATIVTILRPSANIAYGRINPACDLPIVLIKNNGSDTLKSLQFEYYTDSGKHLTYQWSGTLPFLDTTSVTLPIDSVSFWTTAKSGNFHVDISQPNGVADDYDHDNHYATQFTQPPVYNGIVVVNLVTNKDPQDNYYEVLDMQGDTVFSNGGFDATTTYYDSLMLPAGCYTLRFHDDGEDGLNYWANPNQGAGSLRLRLNSKTGKILNTFNPDLGAGVQFDFQVAQSALGVAQTQPEFRHIGLWPNPATSELNYDLEGMPVGMATIEIVDPLGHVLHREERFTDALGSLRAGIDLAGMSPGTYLLHIVTSNGESSASFVIQ
ncbi:MAG TPA: LamG-like jellyroll fold domain-containing protein [Candidatus Kapabacteria bacterium]|jgi:hypothetical protein